MKLSDIFKSGPIGKLAREVEDVCTLAEEALNAHPANNDLRAMVERVRTRVPPALRRLHDIHKQMEGFFDNLQSNK
jgi:hypothetical protein